MKDINIIICMVFLFINNISANTSYDKQISKIEICDEISINICEFNGFLLKMRNTTNFLIIDKIAQEDLDMYNEDFSDKCGYIDNINDICVVIEPSKKGFNYITNILFPFIIAFILICCYTLLKNIFSIKKIILLK